MHDSNRILILDDQESIGLTIRQMAEKLGLNAESTTCPAQFLKSALNEPLKCLILDLIMPEVSGDQIILELARNKSRIPLLLMSGGDRRVLWAAERSAREHGLNVVGALEKPFFVKNLKNTLEKLPESFPKLRSDAVEAFPELDKDILLEALDKQEFFPVFQPKVDSNAQSLVGFEALLRWFNPYIGNVPPDVFISAAERFGLIDELTEYLFEKALSWFAQQRVHSGKVCLHLALNISALSLDNRGLFEKLIERCDDYGVSPAAITLELTESHAMRDPMASLDTLLNLRLKGFKLSIDDFGTGYSSLKQLVRLPFTELKIDQSFINNMTVNKESRHVVKTIIDMARALHLTTVAEGVESKETFNLLQILGCDQVQGYYIAKPMGSGEIDDWLRQRQRNHTVIRANLVRALKLGDGSRARELTSVTALLSRILSIDYATISLLADTSVVCTASVGFSPQPMELGDTFCKHVISREDVVTINSEDDAADNYQLPESWRSEIHFYAGYPLYSKTGLLLGSLCALNGSPKSLGEYELSALKKSAKLVEFMLENTYRTEGGRLPLKTQFQRIDRVLDIVRPMGYQATLLVLKPHWQTAPHSLKWQLDKLGLILSKSCRRSDIVIRISEREYGVLLIHSVSDGVEDLIIRRVTSKLNQLQKAFDSWCFLGVDYATTSCPEDFTAQALMAKLSSF